jgi:hypothetical protein
VLFLESASADVRLIDNAACAVSVTEVDEGLLARLPRRLHRSNRAFDAHARWTRSPVARAGAGGSRARLHSFGFVPSAPPSHAVRDDCRRIPSSYVRSPSVLSVAF